MASIGWSKPKKGAHDIVTTSHLAGGDHDHRCNPKRKPTSKFGGTWWG